MGLTDQDAPNDAHQIALDFSKQIITLAAGVLALSGTFVGTLGKFSSIQICLLAAAWLALISSVFFGLETISTIVRSRLDLSDSWSFGRPKLYATLSKYLFFAGLVLFAIMALSFMVKAPGQDSFECNAQVHASQISLSCSY